MPKKYRLVRTEPGVLDVSQILDDRGKPILLSGLGAETIVNEHTLKHPLVARYLGAGLAAEEVSLKPSIKAPMPPVVPATTAPPPAPPPPAPPVEPKPTADSSPVMTSADASTPTEPPLENTSDDADNSTKDADNSETSKKAKTSRKSSRRSRDK